MNAHQIIVVDSNPDTRTVIRGSLRRAGYHVVQAADGAEALEIIEKVRPSLILLNLTLPIVDSLSVLTGIQYFMGRQARVVLTGAHQVLLRAVQSAKLNIDGFLETPIAPEDLLLYVATALNHRGETA